MHTFLDNFHQGGKYSAQLASHQEELRREENFPDQTCLNISSLQTGYLNIDSSVSGSSKHNDRAHSFQKKCSFCGLNNHSAEKISKGLYRKRRKLARLMFHRTGIRNVRLVNALDVDLNITWSQNVPIHQKIIKNGESKYVLIKKLIVHATTAKITMTIRYTHLWHEFLVMTNSKV